MNAPSRRNGFCTATHLYVPTVVDPLAAAAVETFARQFKILQPIVNPHIQWGGIVGTMTSVNTNDRLTLPKAASEAANTAEKSAQKILGTREELFIRYPVIERDLPLARAAENGIAYFIESRVRLMFDELAKAIALKAPPRKSSL
ncbi:MAG: hypothetical protein ACREC6_13825 [Hyphomicrobiaceae bacterium]